MLKLMGRTRNRLIVGGSLLLGLWGLTASADVYKRVGRDGQVVFTDRPAGSGYALVIRSPHSTQRSVLASGSSETGSMVHRLKNGQVVLGNGGRQDRIQKSGSPLSRGGPVNQRAREFSALIDWAASVHGLDPWLLHAVIRAESSYNPQAVSPKGAMGLMQLMPGTAARYGVADPYNPEQNVLGGARYLRDLMGLFGSDVRLAVAAYNAGEGNVQKYGYQIPPFEETRGYVAKVLDYYRR